MVHRSNWANLQIDHAQGEAKWLGAFTRTGVLIGVRGYVNTGSYLSFDLKDRHRLIINRQEDRIVQQASF